MEYTEFLRVYDVTFSFDFAILIGAVHNNLSYVSSAR